MNTITIILVIFGIGSVLSIHEATFTKRKIDYIIAFLLTFIFVLIVLFNLNP